MLRAILVGEVGRGKDPNKGRGSYGEKKKGTSQSDPLCKEQKAASGRREKKKRRGGKKRERELRLLVYPFARGGKLSTVVRRGHCTGGDRKIHKFP